MAEQKKQHYIPRFYFKLFSPNKRSIEVYNLKSKNAYSGSYRKLCTKNYFYSKRGEVETSLSSIEGESSKVINKLIGTHDISSLTIEDAFTICAFLAFQNYRTEKEKINFDEIFNLAAKYTLEYLLQTDEKYSEIYSDKTLLDNLKVEMNEGQLNYMFQMYAEGPILLNDLSPLLLINKTQYDFIFSDAPVIFYNSYFNNLGHGTNGLANIGLQIFFPLNQKLMLVLYDRKFYKFQGIDNRCIYIDNMNDISSLNALQFCNCKQNIFYSRREDEKYIRYLHNKLASLIEDIKPEATIITAPDDSYRCIQFYKYNINYTLRLSFMNLIPNKSTELNPIRNPEITEMCRNMSSEIQAKREDAHSKLKENPVNSQITHEYFEYINDIVRNYVIKWFLSAHVFEDWWDDRFYGFESPRDDPRFSALLDEFTTYGEKGPE